MNKKNQQKKKNYKSRKILLIGIGVVIIFFMLIFLLSSLRKTLHSYKNTTCQMKGGKLVTGLGKPICSFPTTDAGKPCNSSSDCESVCTGVESGRCYEWTSTVGTCLPSFENGNYDGAACSD